MAAYVLDNAYLSVTGSNLSSHLRSLSVPQEVAELEATTMGNDTEINEPGLKGWSVTATILNSFGTGSPDAVLSPLVNNRTKFGIEVRPDAGSVSATNPKWTGTAFISSYEPITGSVGELIEATVTFSAASALTRSVT